MSPKRQDELGRAHSERYRRTGDLEDLEAALKYSLAAMAATPEGHSDMAGDTIT